MPNSSTRLMPRLSSVASTPKITEPTTPTAASWASAPRARAVRPRRDRVDGEVVAGPAGPAAVPTAGGTGVAEGAGAASEVAAGRGAGMLAVVMAPTVGAAHARAHGCQPVESDSG